MTSRMFVAVVPPRDVLDELARFVEPRREAESPLRWTDELQWHLTLAFMAAVPDHSNEELVANLLDAAAKRSPFRLQLGGAGALPSAASARVFYSAVHGELAELQACATGARHAAATAGIEVDGARFRPHLTLARLNRPADVVRWLRAFDGFTGSEWQVQEIQLISSELDHGGRPSRRGRARHTVEATFPLGRPAG